MYLISSCLYYRLHESVLRGQERSNGDPMFFIQCVPLPTEFLARTIASVDGACAVGYLTLCLEAAASGHLFQLVHGSENRNHYPHGGPESDYTACCRRLHPAAGEKARTAPPTHRDVFPNVAGLAGASDCNPYSETNPRNSSLIMSDT